MCDGRSAQLWSALPSLHLPVPNSSCSAPPTALSGHLSGMKEEISPNPKSQTQTAWPPSAKRRNLAKTASAHLMSNPPTSCGGHFRRMLFYSILYGRAAFPPAPSLACLLPSRAQPSCGLLLSAHTPMLPGSFYWSHTTPRCWSHCVFTERASTRSWRLVN